MPKISVILPAYNVEAFIARCLRSLQAQTVTDWEAVCVDDGSTDRTPQILDGFAGQDARIRVIHQPNGGASAARNRALPAIGTLSVMSSLGSVEVSVPSPVAAVAAPSPMPFH